MECHGVAFPGRRQQDGAMIGLGSIEGLPDVGSWLALRINPAYVDISPYLV